MFALLLLLLVLDDAEADEVVYCCSRERDGVVRACPVRGGEVSGIAIAGALCVRSCGETLAVLIADVDA